MAIKKIEKTFDHKIYAKRTLRELKILRLLKHENVCFIIKINWLFFRSSASTQFFCQNQDKS